jgi:hypothetical protein|tara:strand:- start:116 stop:316 length:201 start_codon:yes stop_codon:yes gene_type:complete
MKIFLTEVDYYGKVFAGPNIVADNIESATKVAENNGLTLVGELETIVVTESGEYNYQTSSSGETLH